MAKYLIVTKEGDFVSESSSAKNHLKKSQGEVVMVYDTKGYLVDSARRKSDGTLKKYGTTYSDGESRIWAKAYLKKSKVGDKTKSAIDDFYK